jgi:two-component system cell cycle response regulator
VVARILVIEDSPTNRQLLVYLLGSSGHEVLAAADGDAGLAVLAEESVDLVICDVQLPGADGIEVCRRIRSGAGSATPLIAVTAHAMVGDRDTMLGAGFDAYISKPIEPETFVRQVEMVLDGGVRSSLRGV